VGAFLSFDSGNVCESWNHLSSTDGQFDDEYFQPSEQANQFKQEFEMRRMKQASNL